MDLPLDESRTTVVTPNNRLARFLLRRHDARRTAAGDHTWPTPRVLAWGAWLPTLWLDALAAGAFDAPFTLIDAPQSLHLWERAIEADGVVLVDRRAAAERAQDAWEAFHAYAAPGEAPSMFTGGGDDAAAFARWAARFARGCADAGALDAARLADRLAGAFARMPSLRGTRVVLAGFVELAPQQERLLRALRGAGVAVERTDVAGGEPTRSRARYLTEADEMVAALQWARARIERDPGATATIAVIDLASRVEAIAALAAEILQPTATARGVLAAAQPFNISAAPPLSANPLVVAALDVVALLLGGLPLARAAALVRSPFLRGGAVTGAARAAIEGVWRERNLADVSARTFIDALDAHDRWRDALESARRTLRAAPPQSPRGWADAFGAALAAAGWPGDDPLSSAQWQAAEAFRRAVGQWRHLALVAPRLNPADALASLRAHCTAQTFQPEGRLARIEILGILEAAGHSFDGLWLAGMDVDAWPMHAAPKALLPVAWQRARGVAGATPASALARAEAITAQLAGGAREVVASHVTTTERPPRRVSSLVAWPLVERPAAPTPTEAIVAAAPALVAIDDARLPSLAPGSAVRGGAGLVTAMAECAFRAGAAWRLGAWPWPRPLPGLTPAERGLLVHATLAALWAALGSQAALAALDDHGLAAAIEAAVDAARPAIENARWRALPPIAAAAEGARLARIVRQFVDAHERTRPSFVVEARERKHRLSLGGLVLDLRVDRIDRVGNGVAVIDYKTGDLPSYPQWLMPRSTAPQLGLYALALAQLDPPQAVDAVALMSLKSGRQRTRGIAIDPEGWAGMTTPAGASKGALDGFGALAAKWDADFGHLARAFREGDAGVLPRETANPCPRCAFKPLCRIGAARYEPDDDTADDAE
jgi:probable DNA repair protein